jgi:lysophospholipase L1-like esterase
LATCLLTWANNSEVNVGPSKTQVGVFPAAEKIWSLSRSLSQAEKNLSFLQCSALCLIAGVPQNGADGVLPNAAGYQAMMPSLEVAIQKAGLGIAQ